jgi:predicted CoA-binding protein
MNTGLLLLICALLLLTNGVIGFTTYLQSFSRLSPLSESFFSGGVQFKSEKLMKYFDLPVFLVIGASEDRTKFGNKILRCMMSHKKQCIPLNKRLSEIEGLPTVDSLATLVQQLPIMYPSVPISEVGMNLITPPPVTLILMRQGYDLGMRNFFCQPGTTDGAVEVTYFIPPIITVCLSVRLFVCLFVCVSVCLCVYLCVCVSVYLSDSVLICVSIFSPVHPPFDHWNFILLT